MPDNFAVVINETVTIWSAIKITLVVIAGLYLVAAATSWDKRALSGLVLCLAMWLLTGCTINGGAQPADAMIAASQAQQAQAQANSQAQQKAAQLAAEAQAAQLTALQVAQSQAQTARSDAQAQQAMQVQLQAQADAQQAVVMAGAITALDKANERASERSAWLGWLLVAIVIGALGIAGMAVYFRGRVAVASVQVQPVQRPALPVLTDMQILELARSAGYLVDRAQSGRWIVLDPNTRQQVSRKQLLLEVQG